MYKESEKAWFLMSEEIWLASSENSLFQFPTILYSMGYYYYGPGAGARSSTTNSVFNGLTLSPLPYPVLLILAVICIFLGISWYSSYEEAVETAEEGINWLLLAIPISIVFLVKWLSSMEDCFGMPFFDRRRTQPGYCAPPTQVGGASPWGVAALIILLLVLIHCQSSLFA